jgi:hypothetical protein
VRLCSHLLIVPVRPRSPPPRRCADPAEIGPAADRRRFVCNRAEPWPSSTPGAKRGCERESSFRVPATPNRPYRPGENITRRCRAAVCIAWSPSGTPSTCPRAAGQYPNSPRQPNARWRRPAAEQSESSTPRDLVRLCTPSIPTTCIIFEPGGLFTGSCLRYTLELPVVRPHEVKSRRADPHPVGAYARHAP